MNLYVADASVVIKWLFPEEHSDACRKLLFNDNRLIAPDFAWAEIGNVVWKKVNRGELSPEESRAAASDLLKMPVLDVPSKDLMPAALEIAVAADISVYDALYVSLAISRDCHLITADRKLVEKLAGTVFEQFVQHVSQAN